MATSLKEFMVKKDFSSHIDSVMNTHSFRKLSGKTQVILSLTGPSVRTRLTHTVEVARIAREICKRLELKEDLAEAIALSHDLGHTPFGHVGERTLKEVMCGCDTLERKIVDLDFANSGFKHNLQSFRVLKNIENITKDDDKWPYILWGVIVHSKASYAPPDLAMDNEIYISCELCNLVYNCYFDIQNQRLCKRNQKIKIYSNKIDKVKICVPWYCSKIEKLKKAELDEISFLESQRLGIDISGEKSKNKIDQKISTLKGLWSNTYCIETCYLAMLWQHKQNNLSSNNFIYLFDHPFPNSFYSNYFNDYFFINGFKDCISVESHIVKQADEIAQRKEDLEDGITKNLISRQEAHEQVNKLFENFKAKQKFIDRLKDIDTNMPDFQLKLSELLVDFYEDSIVESTYNNFQDFKKNTTYKAKINYFCLLAILNEIKQINAKEWLLEEMREFSIEEGSPYLEKLYQKKKDYTELFKDCLYEINDDEAYLYLLIYFHLERGIKKDTDLIDIESIFESFKKILKEKSLFKEQFNKLQEKKQKNKDLNDDKLANIIYDLEVIKSHLENEYTEQYKAYRYHKKDEKYINTYWKNIVDLDLFTFGKLLSFLQLQESSFICTTTSIKKEMSSISNTSETFDTWKNTLKLKGNQVIAGNVDFVVKSKSKAIGRYLKDFEKKQADTILKSEIVEKNDGKASFILKRLFKAYLTNPHQLPDTCLRNILINLKIEQENFLMSTSKEFDNLIFNLKGAFPRNYVEKDVLDKIKINVHNLSKELSIFINYLIDAKEEKLQMLSKKIESISSADTKKKKACEELSELIQDIKNNHNTQKADSDITIDNLVQSLNSYYDLFKKLPREIKGLLENKMKLEKYLFSLNYNQLIESDDYSRKQVRAFRRIIDNAVLNAVQYWKSILTRGICDYIAGLTDQEAIDEYEKLYAGIMELV